MKKVIVLYGDYVTIECLRVDDSDDIIKPIVLLEAQENTPKEMSVNDEKFNMFY